MFRRFSLVCRGVLLGTLCSVVVGEIYFRATWEDPYTTPGCGWIGDSTIGFVNPPRKECRHSTFEFDYSYSFNSDGHPDDETRLYQGASILMALGDSHTRAVGVSNDEAWPNVAERVLREQDGKDWQVVNMGVAGYNLGQEFQLMERYLEEYRPRQVVLCFSMATDAYDIRPPAHGEFIYGSNWRRNYYDIQKGNLVLVEHNSETPREGHQNPQTELNGVRRNVFSKVKDSVKGSSKLYQALRRGLIGMYGVRVLRMFGIVVWPNAESILATELSPVDTHSWNLVAEILFEFQQKLTERDIGFTVVVLPYLPQVYDEVWNRAFSWSRAYERFSGNERLEKICKQLARIDHR